MKIEMFSKAGCHLCEEAKAIVEKVQKKVPFNFVETDISLDPALEKKFGEQIPVIFIEGKKAFKFFVSEQDLLKKIEARTKPSHLG
ncbi:MAG: glutaredoxin family protein [Nitrospinota bacterium]